PGGAGAGGPAGPRLLHARHRAAAGHLGEAVLHLLRRLHQTRARQHQHRVFLAEAVYDLAVVEVGEPGADEDGSRGTVAQREDDVFPAELELAPAEPPAAA